VTGLEFEAAELIDLRQAGLGEPVAVEDKGAIRHHWLDGFAIGK
jgi:hypothetical protein